MLEKMEHVSKYMRSHIKENLKRVLTANHTHHLGGEDNIKKHLMAI